MVLYLFSPSCAVEITSEKKKRIYSVEHPEVIQYNKNFCAYKIEYLRIIKMVLTQEIKINF